MQKNKLLVIVLIFITWSSHGASIESSSQEIIRIGIFDSALPYQWKSEDGEWHGLLVEYLRGLHKEAAPDSKLEFVSAPHQRAVFNLESRQVDIILALENTQWKGEVVEIGKAFDFGVEVWSVKGSKPKSIESLLQGTVAIPVLYQGLPIFEHSEIYHQRSGHNLVAMLMLGRVDAVVDTPGILLFHSLRQKIPLDNIQRNVLFNGTLTAWTHPDSPVSKNLDAWYKALRLKEPLLQESISSESIAKIIEDLQ